MTLRQPELLLFVGILLRGCSGFVEDDVQCQHPLDSSRAITVNSSKICDGVFDCSEGVDESADLCGNVRPVKVGSGDQSKRSVHVWWDVLDDPVGSPDGSQPPDGFFVTWKSARDSSTVKLEDPEQRSYTVDGLVPGTNYTFFVRPYVASEATARGYAIGKASSCAETTRVADPENVTLTIFPNDANVVGVLAWRAAGHVDSFEVRVLRAINGCMDCYDWSSPLDAITVEASDTDDRTYSVVVAASLSRAAYHVSSWIYGEAGSDVILYRAVEPEPTPRITYVAALNSTSFEMRWEVEDRESHDFFVASYCAESSTSCGVTQLNGRSLTIDHLLPGTKYDVDLRIPLDQDGTATVLSRPARASVSTWTTVPQAPEIVGQAVVTEAHAVVLGWTFYNSTLDYVQFLVDQGEWQNCSESFHCSLTTVETRTSSARKGTVRLFNLVPNTQYRFLVRGCNGNGCGPSSGVSSTTRMAAPSAPVNVRGSVFGNGTALVQWEPPLQPRGPTSGYQITWRCGQEGTAAARVTGTAFLTTDISEGKNCSWSVAAYHVTREGHLLFGEPGVFSCRC